MSLFASLFLYLALGPHVEEVRLSQLQQRLHAGRDTAYVVNFWATWCKPCVEELPAFDKLSRTYKDQPVKVILVSLDNPAEREAKVVPFLTRRGYEYCDAVVLNEPKPHLWIDRVDQSWSGSIPATLFIKDGRRLFGEFQFSAELLEKTFTDFLNEGK
ncbi:MAG: TlpA family protein disulfide reductase [Ignavibacteria bacterium]|nr:TlpA family protein disulfide reductase [Ignavibacteria bacterium]